MNVRVAHDAVAAHHAVVRGRSAEGFETGVGLTGVARSIVAALAELGRFPDEQGIVVASVRYMAIGAILGRGGMVREEGASFFRMTPVTEFVYRRGLHHVRAETPVREMTVEAQDLALLDGVMRPSERL